MVFTSFCVASSLLVSSGSADAQDIHLYAIDNTLPTGAIPKEPITEIFQANIPTAESGNAGLVELDPDLRLQKMVGVGAAFSEIGTLAFSQLALTDQNDLLKHLFSTSDGAGFQMCRLPVGSSDFATSPYSYDDHPGDYKMNSFTLKRDEKSIVPVVKSALKINPSLMLFASPWSPPGWMKKSGKIDGGGQSSLIDEENIYVAYALYFQKYLQGYLADGIPISRLCPQNEMDCNPGYPGSVMRPEIMIKFVTRYLAPQLKSAAIKTEIWPGTFREGLHVFWAEACLKNEAFRKDISGLGVQYCNPDAIKRLGMLYPHLGLMFTEANANSGKNLATEAQARLGEMIKAFDMGCDAYAYWNMILDENQQSGWHWHQNSLITIDRKKLTVSYNADYQPIALVSKFLRPGDVHVSSVYQCGKDQLSCQIAFVKPDGSYLIFAQNTNKHADKVIFQISGIDRPVMIPAHSDCAILLSSFPSAQH